MHISIKNSINTSPKMSYLQSLTMEFQYYAASNNNNVLPVKACCTSQVQRSTVCVITVYSAMIVNNGTIYILG